MHSTVGSQYYCTSAGYATVVRSREDEVLLSEHQASEREIATVQVRRYVL